MAFNMFPYTNFHELNADWILQKMKESLAALEAALAGVSSYESRLQQAEQDIDALEGSRVSYTTEQQLTDEQQVTARGNIGAAPSIGVVYYKEAQALSEDYKAQARQNIGAAAAGDIPVVTGVVHYDEAQSLTDEQKLQARSNIGAAASSAIPDVSDVLRYSSQSLNTAQKLQARNNIDAANADREPLPVFLTYENGAYTIDCEPDQILDAIQSAVPVVLLCKEMGSYPNAPAEIPDLRDGLITEFQISRQGTSSDYSIMGWTVLSYNQVAKQMIVFRVDISLVSGVVYILTRFDDLWGIPAPDVSDAGKFLTINLQGDAAWSSLPVYSGGVT